MLLRKGLQWLVAEGDFHDVVVVVVDDDDDDENEDADDREWSGYKLIRVCLKTRCKPESMGIPGS